MIRVFIAINQKYIFWMVVLSESASNYSSDDSPSSISCLANTEQLLWSEILVLFGHLASHCIGNSAHPRVACICYSDNDCYSDHIVLKDLAEEKQKAQAITNSKYKYIWFPSIAHYRDIVTHYSVSKLNRLGHHNYTKADRHISWVYLQILTEDILNTNYYHDPTTCK